MDGEFNMKLGKLIEHLELLDKDLDVKLEVILKDDEGTFSSGGLMNSFKFNNGEIILSADDQELEE